MWVIVRDYKQFVSMIQTRGVPEFISFDHDLADVHYAVMLKDVEIHGYEVENKQLTDISYGLEKTGYDCAKWLVDFCIDNKEKFPEYVVHSMNPVGAERIRSYVQLAKQKGGV